MTVRPVSKPPLFVPDPEPERVAWWCSACTQRVPGPWHKCGEDE